MDFPLAAIGAGLGQGVQALQQQQNQALQNRIRLFALQQAIQQKQQQEQAAPGVLAGLLGGGDQVQPTPSPFPGADGGTAPLTSSLPGSTYMPGSGVTNMAGPPGSIVTDAAGSYREPTDYGSPEANAAILGTGRHTAPGASLGGGLAAGGALTGEDQTLDLIARDESGGRNIMQQAIPPGGGYNPSVGRVTGPSTAQGFYQITNSTWRTAAPAAGVSLAKYPTAMTAPPAVQRQVATHLLETEGTTPWAPYNPKLRQDLAGGSGIPPQAHQEATQGAQIATQSIDPMLYGRMSTQALARRIDAAMPGADPLVKVMAIERASKILAPDQRLQLQALLNQHREDFQRGLLSQREQFETGLEAQREAARERTAQLPQRQGYQTLTSPDQKFQYEMIPGQPNTAMGMTGKPLTDEQKAAIEGGVSSKIGSVGQGTPAPQTVDYAADMISQYRMAPISGWALRSPYGQAVMAEVAKKNPQYDATKYNQKLRGQIAFTSGRQGDAVRSFSVSIDHLAVMDDVAKALANGDVQALNRLGAIVKREFGYEGPVDFNFTKAIVGDEISKAIIGGVGSTTDRIQLQNAFQVANSPEQMAGVIALAKRLMAGQLGGYRRQAGSAGFSAEDFERALSPQAKAELEGLGAGAPAPAAPADGAPAAGAGTYQDGDTATNPQTGQKLMYRGGQWVPLPAGGVDVPPHGQPIEVPPQGPPI